ncbi:hypothetical protein H113_00237 [Trichophyton rubrum MR1459]|uniref:Uncharacterized protein n=1 Tax=Trichophyton rubrum (strain ATCC MYA-4607 / CBS 118892) TaxID=559305 RepID=A0A080WYE4_TRIRC|nr:uncharacterized protein TERG_12679 [Trichophyton rubrum CBS 118892]EZG00195.1 hypothetical protein H113_00237 [Trichophyton rubrum MR1459]EZG11098.1 hypothetical protein H106_00129 [Trichophyton rubrum CBS 735.88]KFL63023.1 hypothetical protein TERG_12679 [Trichophyton rubrum CBS 118892]
MTDGTIHGTSASLSSPNPKLNPPPPTASSAVESFAALTTSSHFLFFLASSSSRACSRISGWASCILSTNKLYGSSISFRKPDTWSALFFIKSRVERRCLRGTKFCVMAIDSDRLTTRCHQPEGTCRTSPSPHMPSRQPGVFRASSWKLRSHSAMLRGEVTSDWSAET